MGHFQDNSSSGQVQCWKFTGANAPAAPVLPPPLYLKCLLEKKVGEEEGGGKGHFLELPLASPGSLRCVLNMYILDKKDLFLGLSWEKFNLAVFILTK